MPSWWYDLIRVTGETLLKQHTNLLLQCGQQGVGGNKQLTQSQKTQSYKEITGKKNPTNTHI